MRRVRRVPASALRVDLPSVTQRTDYTCGAAALLAIAQHYRISTDEQAIVHASRMGRDGSDPVHLIRAVRRLRLRSHEMRGASDAELRAVLAARRPVLLALQAWGEGHWVVAIGSDARGVYVEDPWLGKRRGFLTWRELSRTWRDVEGRPARPLVRYALAVWR